METLTVGIIFYYAEDWACVSRTLDYVGEHFERIIARSTTRHISTSALLHMLWANRRAKEDMIRLEMAAVIDGGSIFRNKTYFLEGDGALIFVAYDTIMSLFAFIDNSQWDNVDAVIQGLVANLPNPGSETPQSTYC